MAIIIEAMYFFVYYRRLGQSWQDEHDLENSFGRTDCLSDKLNEIYFVYSIAVQSINGIFWSLVLWSLFHSKLKQVKFCIFIDQSSPNPC